MARTKGSKNKPKVECLPPEDRGEILPAKEEKEEVISCLFKVITRPNGYHDAYCVGKHANGKPFVIRLEVGTDTPPLTNELKKKLGVE
jgi:hypothetical protein